MTDMADTILGLSGPEDEWAHLRRSDIYTFPIHPSNRRRIAERLENGRWEPSNRSAIVALMRNAAYNGSPSPEAIRVRKRAWLTLARLIESDVIERGDALNALNGCDVEEPQGSGGSGADSDSR